LCRFGVDYRAGLFHSHLVMRNTTNQLTVSEGRAIQRDQLTKWKSVLNPEAFAKLHYEVLLRNDSLDDESDGFDVCRGGRIDQIVFDLMSNA
jgi:hypothetical protein